MNRDAGLSLVRVERGWILVNGTRQDDGTIKLGPGGEMRFSPFEAMSQRADAQITWGASSRRRYSGSRSGAGSADDRATASRDERRSAVRGPTRRLGERPAAWKGAAPLQRERRIAKGSPGRPAAR